MIPPPLFVERARRRFLTRGYRDHELVPERAGHRVFDDGKIVHWLDDDEVVRVHERTADAALLRLRGAEFEEVAELGGVVSGDSAGH